MPTRPFTQLTAQVANTPSRQAMLDEFIGNMAAMGRTVTVLGVVQDEVIVRFEKAPPSPESRLYRAAYGGSGQRL